MQKDLALTDIRIDGGTQQRPVDDAVVSRYVALIKEGANFPPISVIQDGKNNWLFDGFHRFHAYRKLNKKYIAANVENGTKREAIWFSFHANHDHGFPRQDGTGKEIVLKILADTEWVKSTQKAIADWVGVTQQFVSRIIAERKKELAEPPKPQTQKTTTKTTTTKTSESPEPESTPKMLDSVGEVVPTKLMPIFARVDEIKTHIRCMNKMLKEIKEARAKGDLLWVLCKINPLEVEVKNCTRNLKFSLPYAVCRYCRGDGKGCRACGELGFCNEQSYRATAEELKK